MRGEATNRSRGSVIVMVTVALLLLFGMMGMVVDIGLAYYYRRASQAAADAAVGAGVKKAYELGVAKGSFTGLDTALIEEAARAYATRNGFTANGDGGKQAVEILQGSGKYPTGEIGNLNIYYWVEARVKSEVRSLFIGASGAGPKLESGATAVGAVIQSPLIGSVFLLNRSCDPQAGGGFDCLTPDNAGPDFGPGVDMVRKGNGNIQVDGAVLINSSANGAGSPGGPVASQYAVQAVGGGSGPPLVSPFVQFAWDGNYKGAPSAGSNMTGYSWGPQVEDPTYSMNFGQQPRVKTVQELLAEPGGPAVVYGVTGSLDGATLGPGVYVKGAIQGANGFVPNGDPIVLKDVTFTTPNGSPGTFIFLGGMDFNQANANFAPGVYVAAGTTAGNYVLNVDRSVLQDNGGGASGEMFLLTRPDYQPDPTGPKLLDLSGNPTGILPVQVLGGNGQPLGGPRNGSFSNIANPAVVGFGPASLKSGQGNADIDLTGLKGRAQCNPGAIGLGNCTSIDAQLYHYQPALLWQDRRNCVGVTPDLGGPCQGTATSAKMELEASAFGGLNGLIYQPRGAYLDIQGNGTKQDATTLITGAIRMDGGANITLTPNSLSATQTKVMPLIR